MAQMELMNGFWLGIVGGIIPELYALYKLRHTFHDEKPAWFTSWFYWIITLVMVLLGGGTVCLYISMGVNVNALIAIHLGMATPLLISTALKEKPKIG